MYNDIGDVSFIPSPHFYAPWACWKQRQNIRQQSSLHKKWSLIWSHLLKKSLMENFISCAVLRYVKMQLFQCILQKFVQYLGNSRFSFREAHQWFSLLSILTLLCWYQMFFAWCTKLSTRLYIIHNPLQRHFEK